jgi:hypothetical protein
MVRQAAENQPAQRRTSAVAHHQPPLLYFKFNGLAYYTSGALLQVRISADCNNKKVGAPSKLKRAGPVKDRLEAPLLNKMDSGLGHRL